MTKENKLVTGLMEETSMTTTENGMSTYETSMNACLDLFFMISALRGEKDERRITTIFSKAFNENKTVATLILFWSRNIRGGAGERRVFRIITRWLNKYHKDYMDKLIPIVPEYGRWDDIFELDSDTVYDTIADGLCNKKDGLLAKWLPRKGEFANKVRKVLGLTPKEYRKLIVNMTKVVETDMCNKMWNVITYESVPSQAFSRYKDAFKKHDEERFNKFIEKAIKGETGIKANAIHPH